MTVAALAPGASYCRSRAAPFGTRPAVLTSSVVFSGKVDPRAMRARRKPSNYSKPRNAALATNTAPMITIAAAIRAPVCRGRRNSRRPVGQYKL